MARLVEETIWRGLIAGDVFRVPGIARRRFRFRAFVTNLENGQSYIDAADCGDGRYRMFRPDTPLRRDRRRVNRDGTITYLPPRKARGRSGGRDADATPEGGTAVGERPQLVEEQRLFD